MVDGIWTSATAVHMLSTDDGLARFDEGFVDPAKRALLRDITFQVVLPEISIKRLKKVQSNAEPLLTTLPSPGPSRTFWAV